MRLEVAVRVAAFGANFVAGCYDVADVVVLIVMFVVVVLVMFFAVLVVTSVGVTFAVLVLVVMFFVIMRFGSALTDCLARQNFGCDRSGSLRRTVAMGITMPMAVIVVFEIFENVADVQESVAVETDIDERGLHTGKDARDAAFVDATDEREFFFALDINFD